MRKNGAKMAQILSKMAIVKLHLDTRFTKKGNVYPLKLYIRHKSKFMISLGIDLTKEEWDGHKIIQRKDAKKLNYFLEIKLSSVKSLIFELSISGKLSTISDKELKKILEKNDSSDEKSCISKITLLEEYNKYVSSILKKNTYMTYNSMLYNLKLFCENIEELTMEEINISWIKDFDTFMKKRGIKDNARGVYFRNLRTLFNDAIDREVLSQNYYPFRRFKIPKEETIKRSLTAKELVTLRDYPCEEYQKKYVDLFMLIFYLRGINAIDLSNLTEIKNNRVNYRRSKTGKIYSIEILPEAKKIIDKYRGEKRLLCFFDGTNYQNIIKRMNLELQKIGETKIGKHGKKKIKPLFPNITSYWARHTWATIASSINIPKETIAESLGHGKKTVTDIYIKFDERKIDRANKKVCQFIRNFKV